MGTLRILYALMKADFLERVRRPSFFWMLLFAVVLTTFFVPGDDAPAYMILVLGGYRPIYNSAWLGTAITLLMSEFFLLFGFYLVKNTIERDRTTGVGEIIATTPLTRPLYTLGKWLSNVAVLAAMVGAMIISAALLQWIRAEDMQLDLWALASPLLIVLLPSLTLVAALALLFECISWLRGGPGNLIYFFGAFSLLTLLTDWNGVRVLWPGVYAACSAHFGSCNPTRQIDLDSAPISELATFVYPGVTWTPDIILSRLVYIAAAAGVAMLAALFFHRFDSARVGRDRFGELFQLLKQWVLDFITQPATVEEVDSEQLITPAPHSLSRPAIRENSPFRSWIALLSAELKLVFQGVHWFWYLGAALLIGAGLLLPDLNLVHFVVLPLAWIWPIFRFSTLGVRENLYHTRLTVFSSPFPLSRQLIVTWIVGFSTASAMAAGVIIRLLLAGAWPALMALLIGAAFLSALALLLGCLSGTTRLFEAVYLFFWYLAAVQGVIPLDFMGRFQPGIGWPLPVLYAGLTLLALSLAVWGRWRQIQ